MNPKVVGLTGGIATGKSAVAEAFEELGVPVVDADQISRDLRKPGNKAHQKILEAFGTDVPSVIRSKIFEDPESRKKLESILHPLIQKESERQFKELAKKIPDAPFYIYEAALLVEAGRADDFPALIVVTSPIEDRIQRICIRDSVSKDEAKRAISSQSSDAVKLAKATHHIGNDGTLEELKEQVQSVFNSLKGLF